MIFDVYFPFTDKKGEVKPGIKPVKMEWSEIVKLMGSQEVVTTIEKIRADLSHKNELKKTLPAVCFTGISDGTRLNAHMTPTQLVMLDIDHCEEPREAFNEVMKKYGNEWFVNNVVYCGITPSGKGLRFVFFAHGDYGTMPQQMDSRWQELCYVMSDMGDNDEHVKDFSRISYLTKRDDILFENARLYMNTDMEFEVVLENPAYIPVDQREKKKSANTEAKKTEVGIEVETFTDAEKEEFDNLEYRGVNVKLILDKYLEKTGTPKPGDGEIHNFYNELVKNFRNLTNNNKRALLYLLPRFGHTEEECWSQIKSICKVNTLSTLPKDFYFFMKDNGFYKSREDARDTTGQLKSYMMQEEAPTFPLPPYLPPVFRELVRTAPRDYILPTINALLPIMGTLTSYIGAVYPYDNRVHTTSFFSIIWAPPGTGKSFVERFQDLLFTDLKIRDEVQNAREKVYLRFINRKGSNEKSPDRPATSMRIIPPKNSESEFLEKQSDNHGYHMFTYAPEMDSWAKGVRAAGGNKDDMIRIAWDNGEYGQAFKSAATFKGMVRLYWNVLICGTLQQIESYFRNVENGLVTRCSFFSIDNQEFKEAQVWKKLSKRDLQVIRKFVARCDENTYEEPCEYVSSDLVGINDDDFDKEIKWQFKFKERQIVDMDWIMPTINEFHRKQIKLAALEYDKARDVFRRRVGVRGFRLALMCMSLWEKPTKKNLEDCTKFVAWWMERDLESILKLWGAKYNEQADLTPNLAQRSLFSGLSETFSRNDVYVVCLKQGIKTPIRNILYNWKRNGFIEQLDKETFKKKKV